MKETADLRSICLMTLRTKSEVGLRPNEGFDIRPRHILISAFLETANAVMQDDVISGTYCIIE